MPSDLDPFFNPRGVAIIGASSNPTKLSHGIVRNMLTYGYHGKTYPVNPGAKEIMGLACYSHIALVPDPVDLAVLILPSDQILQALEDCGKRGIRAVIVISGGFREVGKEGAALEKELIRIASSYQIRIIGPNCVGTMNLLSGLNTTFIKGMPAKGGIGFVSQSGAVCGGIVDLIANKEIGFSHFLSLGNEADVNETDMIRYLGDDPQTSTIAVYAEGIRDGQQFIQTCKTITTKKPILILKAGRSDEGAKAVASHTGSLAGSYAAYQAGFRQSGVIEVETTTDLIHCAMALDWLKPPAGNNVVIVTNSGGPAALASDSLSANGLQLARLEEGTQAKLKEKLNPAAQTANPVDMLGGANENEYEHALTSSLKDKRVDMALAILVPQALVNPLEVAKAITRAAHASDKPVIACLMGHESTQEAQQYLHQNKVPMVNYPEMTGVMFGALLQRSVYLAIRQDKSQVQLKMDIGKIKEILESNHGVREWGEHLTRPVMDACQILLVPGEFVNGLEQVKKTARDLGYPVVLKLASPQALHKSEMGAIAVNIADEDTLIQAHGRLVGAIKKRTPDATIEGFLVEQMAPPGKEVIIGMKRDPSFGPVMMFGLGGIFVELFKDVAFRIAPLTHTDAEEMIQETRAYQLLNGWRGDHVYDIRAAVDVILKLARLSEDFPEILEVEINPLRIFRKGQGALALDCRMILS